MSWKLFLDDERYPPDENWVVARSLDEAIAAIKDRGFPGYISFDHDLSDVPSTSGYNNTGMGLARWIVDNALDDKLTIPVDFEFYVHSQNPIGAENIRRLMDAFLSINR